MSQGGDPKVVKRMAELVMRGGVMLGETCPLDGLPLFRMKSGDVVCPVHGKVIVVSSDEEAMEAEIDAIIKSVEYHAAKAVRDEMVKGDPVRILEWLNVIDAVERIRKLRDERSRPPPSKG